MKPTLEEVKAYFKNAKEVRCLWNNQIYNISKWNILETHSGFMASKNNKHLPCDENNSFCGLFGINKYSKYAKIISYKDEPLTVSKEFILEAHNEACSTWKRKLEEQFPGVFVKDELEVGKWYKASNGCLFNFIKNENRFNKGFGFASSMNYYDNFQEYEVTKCIPATPEEVETALINEAKKRGFEYNNFKCLKLPNFTHENCKKLKYSKKDNTLAFTNCKKRNIVFDNGKWATIIEQPTEMTVAEIEEKLGCKIKIVG
jgi:hypothetical protein